jgi:hypothetical protein
VGVGVTRRRGETAHLARGGEFQAASLARCRWCRCRARPLTMSA